MPEVIAAERPSVSRRERAAKDTFKKPTISRAKRSAARGVGPHGVRAVDTVYLPAAQPRRWRGQSSLICQRVAFCGNSLHPKTTRG